MVSVKIFEKFTTIAFKKELAYACLTLFVQIEFPMLSQNGPLYIEGSQVII